jgi:ribosomal protein S18 acetylase RimI-like enzyme
MNEENPVTGLVRRPATAADTDWARTVHHAAYREVVERQFGPWDDAVQDEFFRGDWERESGFEVLLWNGQECGYIRIVDLEDAVQIWELVILPEFQNLGIGTRVIQDAIARAAHRGVPAQLGTFLLKRAADLYRRLGFVEVGRDETHIWFRRPSP